VRYVDDVTSQKTCPEGVNLQPRPANRRGKAASVGSQVGGERGARSSDRIHNAERQSSLQVALEHQEAGGSGPYSLTSVIATGKAQSGIIIEREDETAHPVNPGGGNGR